MDTKALAMIALIILLVVGVYHGYRYYHGTLGMSEYRYHGYGIPGGIDYHNED